MPPAATTKPAETTQPATNDPAKGAVAEDAAATGEHAAPARVESGEPDEPENTEGESRPTHEEYDRAVTELVRLDLRAREQGHSLVQVLEVAAKNAFGVDLRDLGDTGNAG